MDDDGDDYYGMDSSPMDHVDPAAFQPSHMLSFELQPGATLDLFEDATPGDVGRVRVLELVARRCGVGSRARRTSAFVVVSTLRSVTTIRSRR